MKGHHDISYCIHLDFSNYFNRKQYQCDRSLLGNLQKWKKIALRKTRKMLIAKRQRNKKYQLCFKIPNFKDVIRKKNIISSSEYSEYLPAWNPHEITTCLQCLEDEFPFCTCRCECCVMLCLHLTSAIAIDTMLTSEKDTDIKCEQALNLDFFSFNLFFTDS